MTALTDFVVAAGSYFGLPEGRVMEGSTVDVSNGEMELVLCIRLTSDDVASIGKRMGVLLVEAKVDAAQAAKRDVVGVPSNSEMRDQWNSLPAHQKSAFGSFAKFKAACEQAGAEWPLGASRGVTGLGTAVSLDAIRETEGLPPLGKSGRKAEIPPHVWVPGSELTGPQLAMAMSMDEQGRYAMDPNDLTKEQMEDWGPK